MTPPTQRPRTSSVRTPAGRYGTRRPPRLFYAVGGGLLLTLIAIVGYLGRQAGDPAVTYGVRSFTTADRSVQITFEVRKPPAATAVCALRARDRQGAEVGSRQVVIASRPDGDRTLVVTESLATSRRPVTGEVNGCRLTG